MNFIKLSLLVISLVFATSVRAKLNCEGVTINDLEVLKSEFQAIKKKDREYSASLSLEEYILGATDKRHLAYQQINKQCVKPLYSHLDLSQLSTDNLLELFDVVFEVQFYTGSSELANQMKAMLGVLESQRKDITDETFATLTRRLSGAFIRSRQFEKLNKLAEQYKDIPKVALQSSGKESQRNIMVQSAEKHEFNLQPFELPQSGHIVVVSNPFCNFSKKARNYLAGNNRYKTIFSQDASWIIPVDENLYFEAIAKDPQQDVFPFAYTYQENEWPEIDYWGTPAFYFYKDGKLAYKVVGWDDGREAYIEKGLEKIGLL